MFCDFYSTARKTMIPSCEELPQRAIYLPRFFFSGLDCFSPGLFVTHSLLSFCWFIQSSGLKRAAHSSLYWLSFEHRSSV